jgi:drug/metabolite transporter (DMT)-like permease
MIWLGIAFLLSAMTCYLMLLSWADYSYVMPASSFGYAVVALLGVLVLRESVTSARWAGVALICVGVALVGRTEPRTTRASE